MQRQACPALIPYLASAWYHRASAVPAHREHAAPCGEMHLVIRLGGRPVDIHEADGSVLSGCALVAGMRCSFYVKDTSPADAVGVQLRPGMAEAVLGIPAAKLAGRHWSLDDLWGNAATGLVARLNEVEGEEARVALLEAFLASRLRRARGMHPAIARALSGFDPAVPVAELVEQSGYSHRAYVAHFRHCVGLAPKAYARVLRFDGLLKKLAARPHLEWSALAADSGYSDQPHFNREFRVFTGMTPEAFRERSPGFSGHIPVNFLQDAKPARG